MNLLKHPIVVYAVISATSLAVAVGLFLLGGSIAEVTGQQDTLLGISFKAGGALAGFIIVFYLSYKVIVGLYENMGATSTKINIKVYLQTNSQHFARQDTYSATYTIFNEETGETSEHKAQVFWDAGYLTIHAMEIGEKDYLTIKIKNAAQKIWESDSFHSRSPKVINLTSLN